MKKKRRQPVNFKRREYMCARIGHSPGKIKNYGAQTIFAEIVGCTRCGFVDIPERLNKHGFQARLIADARMSIKIGGRDDQ